MKNQIIPITAVRFPDGQNQTVNARDLHEFLQVGRDFSNWIKGRIDEYGFVENHDFVCSPIPASNGRGGHNKIEYHVSLDMAKELSMVEKTQRGKEARKYFIEVEKQWKAAMTPDLSPLTYDPYVNLKVRLRRSEVANLKIGASLASKPLSTHITDILRNNADRQYRMKPEEGKYGAGATLFPRRFVMQISGEGQLFGALIQPCY